MIRRARIDDLNEVMRAGKKFYELHPIHLTWNAKEARRKVQEMITDHVVIVDMDRGYLRGMIGGLVTPNYFNPEEMFLTELFWWVGEKYRNSTIGMKLFREFEKVGEELEVTAIVMSRLNDSEKLGRVYEKKGYIFQESAYVRRV